MRALVSSFLAVLALAAPTLAQEERRVPGFQEAVDALVAAVRKAAPEGYTVEVNEGLPEDLGWKASQPRTPARVIVIMAPSGAARAFGLLPREGTYTADPEARGQQLVTIGPELVVVGAAQLIQVALTLEEVQAAKPGLDAASAPIAAWEQDARGEVDTSCVRGEVERAAKRAAYVALDVAPGGSVDLPAAWKAGHTAVAYRVLRPDGAFVPPTVAIAPGR